MFFLAKYSSATAVRFTSSKPTSVNFSYNRTGGGAFWIYGYRRCGRGDCQILVLPVPVGLPDFFSYRHIGRQEGSISGVIIPARL
jgi:hypothetical protein